ncbi:putative SNARE associated golgi family protein [Dioscorea sansibarensis]
MGKGAQLSGKEVAVAAGVVAFFALGLTAVYFSMPASDYSFLKMPRSLEELQILRDHLETYTSDYTLQVLVGYFTVYIFMQTFMIPGTVFMSLLAGALFGVIRGMVLVVVAATAGASSCFFLSKLIGRPLRGMVLVVVAATAGASSCFFLSKLIGRPLVFSFWPDKLTFFQAQVAKRREKLLNYMLFLRVTPTLPNTFINLASPIVDVPYHTFFLGTFIGLIPAAYVTVRAGLALGELRSLNDLYDYQSIAILFFIGIFTVTPTLLGKNQMKNVN